VCDHRGDPVDHLFAAHTGSADILVLALVVSEPIPVPGTLAGERIDRAVALLTGWTRGDVQALLARDAIVVDGRPVGKSHRLVEGTVIELLDEPAADAAPLGEPEVALDVRYADDDVIVVAKPAGLVVHPGAGHAGGTLVNGLLARYDLAAVGDPERPGIVHRLDRETSGLLVVARTPEAYDALVRALAAHDVERRYDTVVVGEPEARHGTVDAPIGRSVRNPTRMAVRAGGREARTHYEVVTRYEDAAQLSVSLETGRTHQIRVHLAAIGHPVLGDAFYGQPDDRIDRPFLHAAELAFVHPVSGVEIRCHAPWPEDLERARRALGPAR
jgi:23S rRNA pseudouridine1911/1915/1917 synthase